MNRSKPFDDFVRLRRQGQLDQAVACLEQALKRGQLDPGEVLRAGRLLLAHREHTGSADSLEVRVLGQFTTSWLPAAIAAASAGRDLRVAVADGNYDNVLQELADLTGAPDVVVLVPWHHRLFTDNRSAADRIEDELAFWRQAWTRVPRTTRILQVGYDWVHPGAPGHFLGGVGEGYVGLVRSVNDQLRRDLPDGSFFVDLEQVSGGMGREAFYDPRGYDWAKQPLSEAGTVRLAEHLHAGIRAMVSGPKKVLVTDLDDTLWGGVVGELGPQSIELGETPAGEAYRRFQQFLGELGRQGCLLAVCSKNNPDDARAPFLENRDMVLGLEDFAAFEASWEPKERGLERISQTLCLGLEDFVFFDDNPAERERVRQALPPVEVVEVPEDPSEYVRALQCGLWFESIRVTDEDRQRTVQYRSESQRRKLASSSETVDEYLKSLEMVASADFVKLEDIDRIVQLIGKTNQFNLTTRRHGEEAVRSVLEDRRAIGLAMRMSDRFGCHGLIAVLLAVPSPESEETVYVDTWLMSCRVIGRTAEQFLFNRLLEAARDRGYSRLRGEYIPSKRNSLVSGLYPSLGFSVITQTGSSVLYELELETARRQSSFVQPWSLVA